MRSMAALLILSGLGALASSAFLHHTLMIAVPGLAIMAAWTVALALRAPREFHGVALILTAILCALSLGLGLPFAVAALSLSAAIAAWDLSLMALHTADHPRETVVRVQQRYTARNLILSILGVGVTLLVRFTHVRMTFAAAMVLSCLCLALFAIVLRDGRRLMRSQ